MALTDLATLKIFLGITDGSQDSLLAQLVAAADAIVKNYCKRDLELAVYEEYLDGSGVNALALRQRPVRTTTLTGTTTIGSPIVTGLASTAALLVGQAVIGTGVPVGAKVLTVDSASQVTLTVNAAANGTVPLLFGLAVWLDGGGYYGDGVGAFAAGTQLVVGRDFALKRDKGDLGESGLLVRLGGGIINGNMWSHPWPGLRRGTLTASAPPVWPPGLGNVKVQYTAGYAPVPADLVDATLQVAAWVRRCGPQGGPITSEQIGRYSYQIGAGGGDGSVPELGSIRATLSRYREIAA